MCFFVSLFLLNFKSAWSKADRRGEALACHVGPLRLVIKPPDSKVKDRAQSAVRQVLRISHVLKANGRFPVLTAFALQWIVGGAGADAQRSQGGNRT